MEYITNTDILMVINKFADSVPILIDLNEFDENPGPNCMSFGYDLKQLISSIEDFGLINSPIISRNREGHPIIVTGYRRIMALKALNLPMVPCIDISSSGISPLEQLLLNLSDNLTTRRFNNIEKGMILIRLNAYIQRKDLERQFMRLLDISNKKEIDTLLRIEELDKRTKEYIASGDLPLRTMGLVLDMDIRSRSAVLEWIVDLRFNLNQQLKYIDYISDISINKNIPIFEILSEGEYIEIFRNRRLNRPQKVKKIIELLKNKRYPILSESEKIFSKKISALKLPDRVKITHSSFFESEDYRLEILFKSGKDLKGKIDALAITKGLENLEDPWKE